MTDLLLSCLGQVQFVVLLPVTGPENGSRTLGPLRSHTCISFLKQARFRIMALTNPFLSGVPSLRFESRPGPQCAYRTLGTLRLDTFGLVLCWVRGARIGLPLFAPDILWETIQSKNPSLLFGPKSFSGPISRCRRSTFFHSRFPCVGPEACPMSSFWA
jgi:hypothetical protein